MTTSRTAMNQSGFTLVELLLSLAVGALILGSAAFSLSVTRRSNHSSSADIASSNSAFQTGSRFADDVSSVGPVAGVTSPVGAGETGCGGVSSLLRLIGPTADGTGVQVRSYHDTINDGQAMLQRRTCTGADISAALTAIPSASNVVRDLATGPGSLTATCDDGPITSACRVVEMNVKTISGRTFTVRGTVKAALTPTPTTAPTPVIAPPTGTCTIMASETTWGATGGYAGGSGDLHAGDGTMYTYNDSNRRNSFLRFDLTQPCVGAGDPWPTLPGGRTLNSVTLQLAYMGKSYNGCCGISRDGQIMQPLSADSNWSEATLRGDNMPGGVRGGNDYKFSVAAAGSLTSHTGSGIINSVRQWYAAGGWTNNGWILKRDGVGDTFGKSNKFASRFDSNPALRPRLVITWG